MNAFSPIGFSGFEQRRDLVTNRYLEIETAGLFSKQLKEIFVDRALGQGFEFSLNRTVSLYFDTDNLGFLHNGRTVRGRLAGDTFAYDPQNGAGTVNGSFPHQVALKSLNHQFHDVAQELGRRLYPGIQNRELAMRVRNEIEGAYTVPMEGAALRFEHLPQKYWRGHKRSISDVARMLVQHGCIDGVKDTSELELYPVLLTPVDRMRTWLYLDPNQVYDFDQVWPLAKPSQKMRERGNYLCVELSLDTCARFVPPSDTIGNIIAAAKNDLGKFGGLGVVGLAEYEVEHKWCGDRINNQGVVSAFYSLGQSLNDFARKHDGSYDHVRSKAVCGIGARPECKSGGRWHKAYEAGKLIAA